MSVGQNIRCFVQVFHLTPAQFGQAFFVLELCEGMNGHGHFARETMHTG